MTGQPEQIGEGDHVPAIQPAGVETRQSGVWFAFLARHRKAMEYAVSAPALAAGGFVVLLGYIIGLLAAYIICSALPASTGALDEARRLGVLFSVTILNNYSKSQEIMVYLVSQATTGLVVVGMWWGWCVWRSRVMPSQPPLAVPGGPPTSQVATTSLVAGRGFKPVLVDWGVVPVLVLFVAFDLKRFGSFWQGPLAFLFEEGTFLSTVDTLLRGGVLYRDDFTSYAPMMFYPVKWLMEGIEVNVIMLRWYAFVGDIVGFLLLYHVLRVALRHRGAAFLALGFFLVNYAVLYGVPGELYRPSIHESVLRYSIGLAWLIFYVRGPRSRLDLALTGGALGLALMFSQEIGVVACLVFLAMVVVAPAWRGMRLSSALREVPFVVAGAAFILVPWVVFFVVHGALGDALYWQFLYPRYFGLGFANLPFPPLDRLAAALPAIVRFVPNIEALSIAKGYWMPLAFSVGVVVLGIRWLQGSLDDDDRMAFGLVLIGGMLFRTAMGRSDIVHFQLAFVPAVILVLALARRLVQAIRDGEIPFLSPTVAVGGAAILLSAWMIQPPRSVLHGFLRANLWSVGDKLVEASPGTRLITGIPRAQGVSVPTEFADEFEKTVSYIVTHTAPEEPILVFPHEPAYHFYMDRPSAAGYSSAVGAVTRAERLALIEEWERRRPRYLIYPFGISRIDDLDYAQVFPEVVAYLRQSYAPEQRIGNTLILRRRVAAG